MTCPNSKQRRKEPRAPKSKKSRNLSQSLQAGGFTTSMKTEKPFAFELGSFPANRVLSFWDHMDLRHSPKGFGFLP